jgi:hypothetical protein
MGSSCRVWFVLAIAMIGGVIVDASNNAMPNNPGQFKMISAKDIQHDAASGPGIYDHVDIIGDLELQQNEYKSIKISDSIIEGNVSFSGSTFSDIVNFKNVKFQKNATFIGTTFDGPVDFSNSNFEKAVNFSDSRFNDGATFDYAYFNNDADFSTTRFDKFGSFMNASFAGEALFILSQFNGIYANFESTNFSKDVDFTSSQFNTFLSFVGGRIEKNADFHASKFTDVITFINSSFLGDTNFNRCHFYEESVFRRVYFNHTANFMSARFDGPSFFDGARFHDNASFDSVQFFGSSDFTNATFDRLIRMNSTKISTMSFDGATFNAKSKLFLAKADIIRLMVKWSDIHNILFYDTSAYLSLVKNYRDMGTSDADDCYYQFRRITQDLRSWGWAKILDIMAEITCGYGVRADRPVICSLFLVIACTLVLWAGNGLRSSIHKDKRTSLQDALYYCLAVFFTIPLPDLKPAGLYRYVPVTLRAIAWTLFALLIATLGKVMIK